MAEEETSGKKKDEPSEGFKNGQKFFGTVIALKKVIPHVTNPKIESALGKIADIYGLNEVSANVVGAFGDVVFEASSLKIETVKDVKRSVKAKYATHDIVGHKSRLEFVGLEPDEITFSMQLNRDLGVNVDMEIKKLLTMLRAGEANYLILGNRAVGQGQWVLTSLTIDHKYADREGNPLYAEVDVTLKEALA